VKKLSGIITVIAFIFLYAPIAVMILFSFNSSNSTGVFEGFSLGWYEELFKDSATLGALKNTLIIAITSSVIATVIGTLAAVGIHKYKNRYIKNSVVFVTNIPMMNPDIVTGISMMLLFIFAGTIMFGEVTLNFWTVLISHISFSLPYVILNVLPKLRQMDKNLPEAALDLGCTPMQSFFKIELPEIAPGILTGFIMAFTLSVDDFVVTNFTTGTTFQTLPIHIYSQVKRRINPDMYAVSTLMFIAIFALLLLSNFIGAKEDSKTVKSEKRKKAPKGV
jgi:spermidine/putrescine transport system permease protein